jgi:hypothetical protein
MSFFRHEKIYHFDVRPNWQGDSTATLPAHRYDEFSAGYSLAGCAPAEPPSASPANCSFLQLVLVGNTLPANSNLSLFTVSQGEGAVQGPYTLISFPNLGKEQDKSTSVDLSLTARRRERFF